MLGPSLCLFDQRQEVALTLPKALFDSLDWILWELFVLDNKIVQVISEVVSAGRASVSIEHTKEADLWPVHVKVGFVLGFQNV